MIDFLPEQVRTLNELETATFNFILSNLSSIDKMSVRQLAQAVHVSTATVMRMTRKLGFEGWVELKYYLKNQNQLTEIPVNYYENLLQLDLFLRKITSKEAGRKLEEAVKLIREARYIIFIGVGSSGALAEYGARYFTNIGLESYAISDPYQAVKGKGAPDVFLDSVSDYFIKYLLYIKSKFALKFSFLCVSSLYVYLGWWSFLSFAIFKASFGKIFNKKCIFCFALFWFP